MELSNATRYKSSHDLLVHKYSVVGSFLESVGFHRHELSFHSVEQMFCLKHQDASCFLASKVVRGNSIDLLPTRKSGYALSHRIWQRPAFVILGT